MLLRSSEIHPPRPDLSTPPSLPPWRPRTPGGVSRASPFSKYPARSRGGFACQGRQVHLVLQGGFRVPRPFHTLQGGRGKGALCSRGDAGHLTPGGGKTSQGGTGHSQSPPCTPGGVLSPPGVQASPCATPSRQHANSISDWVAFRLWQMSSGTHGRMRA